MILRHTLIYAGVKFLPALASVATLMVFTRLMSPAQFGEYTLTVNVASTAVAILANFLVIGLGRFEPRMTSEQERSSLHSTVMVTSLILSLAVALVTLFLSRLEVFSALSINYFYFAFLFQLSTLLLLSQKLINANLQPAKYGVSLALKNILLLALGTACLLLGYGVPAVLTSLAFAMLIASFPAVGLWAKTSFSQFKFDVLRSLLSYGAPLTLLYVFVMIINFSDRIFIDVMLGSTEVGLYSAGYDLTQYTMGLVASVVHLSAFPLIVKAYEREGVSRARELLSVSIRILLFLMVPITFGVISIGDEISRFFLGGNFSSTATTLVPVLAIAVLLSTIKAYYFDYGFQLARSTWLQSAPPLIAAACNCALNYFFIKKYGLVGAAYATLLSYFFYLTFAVFLSRRVFKFPKFPWRFFLKIGFSSVIMAVLVSMIEADISLVGVLGLKIFFGGLVFSLCAAILLRKELAELIIDARDFKGVR